MGRRKKKESQEVKHSRAFATAVALLLLLGLVASVYLFQLYLRVNSPGGHQVESFCSVNEGFNCVTVAHSAYSAFLGVPIALYGIDFFLVMLALVGLSSAGVITFRRWDSLLFLATAISLPVCGVLAWISATLISSFCVVCMTIYLVCVTLFLLLLFTARGQIAGLFIAGPRELMTTLKRPAWMTMLAVIGLAFISQFFWAPGLKAKLELRMEQQGIWQTLETSGLTIGPASAPVKIEEFTDFECPHCGRAHKLMMSLLSQFPGKIHMIHRDFPLDMHCNPMISRPMHPTACMAAAYARCAGDQNKYWPFEHLLFSNRESLIEDSLRLFARKVGLDLTQLDQCLSSPRTAQAIKDDIEVGRDRGLTGTPTFFINGEEIAGLRPLSFWTAKIEALIKSH